MSTQSTIELLNGLADETQGWDSEAAALFRECAEGIVQDAAKVAVNRLARKRREYLERE